LMGVDFAGRTAEEREATGVCLGTSAGSLSVDVAFWKSLGNPGGPAPALFTYTLPSTLIGEISIRYGLKGPNLCLMLSPAGSGGLLAEAIEWLQRGEAAAVVCVFADAVDRAAAAAGEATGAGRPGSFACALHLERRTEADRRGRSVLCPVPGGGGDVRRICGSLCGAGA
jgi:3-oxoacyl-(acyl-carrier-protein) synthase